jgi:crotonobetainyl-CoA:carnitine CoA-transferase CaiB-like acyl-CoA transferase
MLRHALDGLTVIDFTQIGAGPTCTMLLADMGARVIKVEPPEGELGRGLGPGWIGNDSALFHGFNRNKLGVCLDLKSPQGLEVAKRLLAQADVLVESMRPGVMNRLGLGHEQLRAEHPRLIYCSVSAYGQSGPCAAQAGVDGILQADSGLMSLIGSPDTEPAKVQAPVVDVVTGYLACVGVLAKLAQRERNGQGGHLDVNLLNSALALQQPSLTSYLANGVLPERIASAAPYSAPNEAFETEDGWIMVAAYIGDRWQRLCNTLNLPHLIGDARFATSAQRVANRAAMRHALGETIAARGTAHWLAVFRDADILCAPVASYADVERHPQVAANAMIASMPHATLGAIRAPGFPINSVECNALPHTPAPSRGQHTREVLAQCGFSDEAIERLIDERAVSDGRCSRTDPAASRETAASTPSRRGASA